MLQETVDEARVARQQNVVHQWNEILDQRGRLSVEQLLLEIGKANPVHLRPVI
jgi:hypothetical protein